VKDYYARRKSCIHKAKNTLREEKYTREECHCGAVRTTIVEVQNGKINVRQGEWT
jgi:hypothetical protein